MADTVKLTVDLDSRSAKRAADSLNKSLKRVGTTAKTVGGGKHFKGLSRSADGAKRSFLGLKTAIAGLGLISLGKNIIQATAEFDDLQTSLNTVFGSINKGEEAFAKINKIATKTPFDIQTLTKAFIQLKAAGIEPTEELITTFGDAASVTTDKIGALQAMIDMTTRTTQGGMGLEDLNRLADRGIPVWEILKEKIGITRLEVSKFGKTAEGSRKIIEALKAGMNERFAGGMERASKNLSTQLSNLKIAATNAMVSIGRNGFGKAVFEAAGELTKFITQNDNAMKKVGEWAGGLVTGAVDTFKFLATHIQQVKIALIALVAVKVSMWFVSLTTSVTALLPVMRSLWLLMARNPFVLIASAVAMVVLALGGQDGLNGQMGALSRIMQALQPLLQLVKQLFTFLANAIASVVEVAAPFAELFVAVIITGLRGIQAAFMALPEGIAAAIEWFRTQITNMGEYARKTLTFIDELFGGLPSKLVAHIQEAADWVMAKWKAFLDWIYSYTKFIVDPIVGAFRWLRDNTIGLFRDMKTGVTAEMEQMNLAVAQKMEEQRLKITEEATQSRIKQEEQARLAKEAIVREAEEKTLAENKYYESARQAASKYNYDLKKWAAERKAEQAAINNLKNQEIQLQNACTTAIQTTTTAATTSIDVVGNLTASVTSWMDGLFSKLFQKLGKFGGFIQSIFSSFGGSSGIFGGLLNGLFGGIGKIFGFADGGKLPGGRWGIVGEEGPELIKGPATIRPLERAGGRGSQLQAPSGDIVFNFSVNGASKEMAMDKAFLRDFAQEIINKTGEQIRQQTNFGGSLANARFA